MREENLATGPGRILTINGGSSSIKFAFYENDPSLRLVLEGRMERIGLPGTTLTIRSGDDQQEETFPVAGASHLPVEMIFLNWLEAKADFAQVRAVGHRVVHGMEHDAPERVTPALLDDLRRISKFDLEHLPLEIRLMETIRQRYPHLEQVACFDTSFHRTMPPLARLLPIPRRFAAAGIQRYGFHGLSYAFLMSELRRQAGEEAYQGRVILAHLGNGASLTAVHHGQSIDTSMGFTPAGGIPMGSRPGDLDPGVVWAMIQEEGLSPEQLNHLLHHQSGLLGISGTSPDMRDLEAMAVKDPRAAEAVAYFCYQVKKWIGAFAAALGGLDTLVFSGGIGENSPRIRSEICAGLEFLGVRLDNFANGGNQAEISAPGGQVNVRVIPTHESLSIVRSVRHLLGLG